MIEIPLTNDASQKFTINLDDITYTMRVSYNSRWGVWGLDVESEDFTTYGVSLVGGVDLFKQHPGPLENVIVASITGVNIDPTRDGLGTDFVLVILSGADLEVVV